MICQNCPFSCCVRWTRWGWLPSACPGTDLLVGDLVFMNAPCWACSEAKHGCVWEGVGTGDAGFRDGSLVYPPLFSLCPWIVTELWLSQPDG